MNESQIFPSFDEYPSLNKRKNFVLDGKLSHHHKIRECGFHDLDGVREMGRENVC